MIFDTHTHYDDAAFNKDRDEVVEGLLKKNVGRICNIGSTMRGAEESVRLAEKYEHVYAAAGIHPDEVYDLYPGMKPEEIEEVFESIHDFTEYGHADGRDALKEDPSSEAFARLKELAANKKTVAIGEIGLDYHGFGEYKDKPGIAIQKYWFTKQLMLAIELQKPAVIHSRNASEDTLEIMRKAYSMGLRSAVIHCYSYSKETALNYIEMGYYLGIGGVLTYEGQKKLTKTVEAVPMERILLETDCPYLTPVPIREKGKWSRNSSEYLPYVIRKIAGIKKTTPEEVERITWENANRFYRIEC